MFIKVKNKYYKAEEINKDSMEKGLKNELKILDEEKILDKQCIDKRIDDKKVRVQKELNELNKL